MAKPFIVLKPQIERWNDANHGWWSARITWGEKQKTVCGHQKEMFDRAYAFCKIYGGTIHVKSIFGDIIEQIEYYEDYDALTQKTVFRFYNLSP